MTERSTGRFVHLDPIIDPDTDLVELHYRHEGGDGVTTDFVELVRFPSGGDWTAPGVAGAVRLLHLVAAVSYYKAFATPTIDLGPHGLSPSERRWLTEFYLDGLGEFAYVNDLDLSDEGNVDRPRAVSSASMKASFGSSVRLQRVTHWVLLVMVRSPGCATPRPARWRRWQQVRCGRRRCGHPPTAR